MRNQNRFFSAGLGIAFLIAVGCAKPGPGTPETTEPVVTESAKAVTVQGDLVPLRTYALKPLTGLERVKLATSMPTSPKVALQVAPRPETRIVRETMIFVEAGSSAGELKVPIDESKDAQVFVGGKSSDSKVLEAAERDLTLVAPTGKIVIDPRVNKAAGMLANSKAAIAGGPTLNAHKLEATHPKGDYTVKVGGIAAKTGFALEVRMPQSKLSMALTPSAHQFLTGENATVNIKLDDAGSGVAGAMLEGWLVLPDGSKGAPVSFKEKGNGEYEAVLSPLFTDASATGIYNVAIRAKGNSNGVKFDRFGMTAIGYAVPTAKIFSASSPKTIEENGKVVALELDVVVDVASADRYEIAAMLAAPAADGSERGVVSSQVAEYLEAGRHTVKLSFDATLLNLAKLEGPYSLRNLHLYSQGRQTMYHHLQRGLDLKTSPITISMLAPLTKITPSIEEMTSTGEFDLTK
jgi:hypothetical protein